MHRSTLRSAVGVLLLALSGTVLAQSGAARQGFAGTVDEHFENWDKDRDGALSTVEIDAQCLDPAVKGAQAAAVAALKRIVRGERYELPALTKAYLTTPPARTPPRAEPSDLDRDREDSGEMAARPANTDSAEPSPAPRVPDWQGGFRQCLSRIERTDRDLFDDEDGMPTIERCHQGPLGDCYFVSVVGAAVKRDAAAVKGMITPCPAEDGSGGGGYAVKFGTGRTVTIAPLTDAEVAISSTTQERGGDDGLWLAVLEKAFGTMRQEDNPGKYATEAATDAIARGGSTRTTIRLLTGHETEHLMLRRKAPTPPPAPPPAPNKTEGTPSDSPAAAPTPAPQPASTTDGAKKPPRRARTVPGPSLVLAGDADGLAAKLRKMVGEALGAERLVTAGTADEKQPPGINPRHAYAVLAFDADKDTLTIWNPHGNTFPSRGKLKGEPGVENGYATRDGTFEVPVADMAKIFRGVTIETDKNAATAKGK